MRQWNLLTEQVFLLESPTGLERVALPELLTALGEDRALSLPRLQPHQESAFHIFLCYLAGAVLARRDAKDPVQAETFWLEGIRELTLESTPACDSAWTLVVDEPCEPAFLQPPIASREDFRQFSLEAETPDALDVLQTAKNHDVKSSRSAYGDPEDWIYALVSLQTMSGYSGAGKYGIARMNGGYGSRPVVALVPSGTWGRHWRSDVRRLLEIRADLLAGPWSYQPEGLVLTWVRPWDRKTSLPLQELDPFFIEVSRAVRLVRDHDRVVAYGATTEVPRLAAKDSLGILGDPWIPVRYEGKKGRAQALTVGPAGLSAELLRNLLFYETGGYQPAAMQLGVPELGEDRSATFSVSVLVRGQGTTDGFHRAEIPIPAKVLPVLFAGGLKRDTLAERSRRALEQAGTIEMRVLKPAVLAFLEGIGGEGKLNWELPHVTMWWQRASRLYRLSWSAELFPWLWRTTDETDDNAETTWLTFLSKSAQAVFETVTREYPRRQGRRYGSQAVAQGIFFGSLFKHFPQLKESSHEPARL